MYRKRMTSELHDSYFCLMTIKHAIPTIEWAIERAIKLLYNSVGTGNKWVGDQTSWRSDELETGCGRERQQKAELPLSIRRKRKTQRWWPLEWGSIYRSSVRSPTPSHIKTLGFSNPSIKWEVHILLKDCHVVMITPVYNVLCACIVNHGHAYYMAIQHFLNISFLFLWSICLRSSLTHFKNTPEYLTRWTAQIFITLIRFIL